MGEKDVIVPFTAVKTAKKNDKWWLTLDETKEDLKNAPASNTTRQAPPGCPKNNPCGQELGESTSREAACFLFG